MNCIPCVVANVNVEGSNPFTRFPGIDSETLHRANVTR
jgi:hypothetical protein